MSDIMTAYGPVSWRDELPDLSVESVLAAHLATNPASCSQAEGERRLMLAVLEHAVKDLLSSRSAKKRADAKRWLEDETDEGTFSFLSVTSVLKIASDSFRTAVMRLVDDSVQPKRTHRSH